jgi:hypothetical protein
MQINKKFLLNNKWTILIILFFIIWKFFLINTLFINESYAKKDTSIYVAHINSVIECPRIIFCENPTFSFKNYTGYEHLTYRAPLGIVGKIFGLNAMETFRFSFYLGTLLIMPVLIIFLKKIGLKNDRATATGLFMLSLYNGAGGYHGFFWVAPSFFSLLLYLLIFSIIIGNYKKWKIWLIILVPLALYVHTLSLYLILSILFFYSIYSFFIKKIDRLMLKKIIFLFFITLILYIPSSLMIKGNPYGIETFSKEAKDSLSLNLKVDNNKKITNNPRPTSAFIKNTFVGFNSIKTDYINWVFPNIIAFVIFIAMLFLLIHYKKKILLSMYLSTFIFTLFATININAVRFLILLWPITFIVYATGFLLSIKFIEEKIQNTNKLYALKIFLFFLLICFSLFNLRYSYLYNKKASVNFSDIIKIESIFKN